MLTLKTLKEGDRVVIMGDHPWATHAGTFLGWEYVDVFKANMPKIQLDCGHRIFVTSPTQVKKTS